jgi:hypothetical protein
MSSMPPLYTRPNCEDAVKNVLWGLQDCVQLGKCSCTGPIMIDCQGGLDEISKWQNWCNRFPRDLLFPA